MTAFELREVKGKASERSSLFGHRAESEPPIAGWKLAAAAVAGVALPVGFGVLAEYFRDSVVKHPFGLAVGAAVTGAGMQGAAWFGLSDRIRLPVYNELMRNALPIAVGLGFLQYVIPYTPASRIAIYSLLYGHFGFGLAGNLINKLTRKRGEPLPSNSRPTVEGNPRREWKFLACLLSVAAVASAVLAIYGFKEDKEAIEDPNLLALGAVIGMMLCQQVLFWREQRKEGELLDPDAPREQETALDHLKEFAPTAGGLTLGVGSGLFLGMSMSFPCWLAGVGLGIADGLKRDQFVQYDRNCKRPDPLSERVKVFKQERRMDFISTAWGVAALTAFVIGNLVKYSPESQYAFIFSGTALAGFTYAITMEMLLPPGENATYNTAFFRTTRMAHLVGAAFLVLLAKYEAGHLDRGGAIALYTLYGLTLGLDRAEQMRLGREEPAEMPLIWLLYLGATLGNLLGIDKS